MSDFPQTSFQYTWLAPELKVVLAATRISAIAPVTVSRRERR
ncbi:hypothetical protein [Microseira wollei]|nr:hypothetical protein [Microseira wollei]